MEVHAHTHTERKKWTHYLWEFFMLFLAVFCGFLAENQREHFVEHSRERQYMQSLYDDLKQDSIELETAIHRTEINQTYIDSLLLFIHTQKIGSAVPDHFVKLDSQALVRLQIVFTDRTASQLKNSGNMRLIRNRDVAEMILKYWNQQERSLTTLDRYIIYRNEARSFATQLVGSYEHIMYFARNLLKDPPWQIKVINSDPAMWTQYANIVAQCAVVLPAHLSNLRTQQEVGRKLIRLIAKKYF